MQVSLRLDSDCLRAFHLLLLQRLAALANVEVSVDARPGGSGVRPSRIDAKRAASPAAPS
ncbi:MAG: hypothetical protein E5W21_11520 [Mesorhizobium sp.]|nr:MAG: hypothetical protein E5W21_11520 [Mesorhizobium sp.]